MRTIIRTNTQGCHRWWTQTTSTFKVIISSIPHRNSHHMDKKIKIANITILVGVPNSSSSNGKVTTTRSSRSTTRILIILNTKIRSHRNKIEVHSRLPLFSKLQWPNTTRITREMRTVRKSWTIPIWKMSWSISSCRMRVLKRLPWAVNIRATYPLNITMMRFHRQRNTSSPHLGAKKWPLSIPQGNLFSINSPVNQKVFTTSSHWNRLTLSKTWSNSRAKAIWYLNSNSLWDK